jgi:hypothetical protein
MTPFLTISLETTHFDIEDEGVIDDDNVVDYDLPEV